MINAIKIAITIRNEQNFFSVRESHKNNKNLKPLLFQKINFESSNYT